LHAPLFGEAFMFSMIYGLGFVLIYPARHDRRHQTAGDDSADAGRPARRPQALAAAPTSNAWSTSSLPSRRSQLAAIAGNVMVALPVALALGLGLSYLLGAPVIPRRQGRAPDRRSRPAELGACRTPPSPVSISSCPA
jgi:site-specific recombinase